MPQQKNNLFLAISLSMLVIVAWMYFYDLPRQRAQRAAMAAAQAQSQQVDPATLPGDTDPNAPPKTRAEVLALDPRLPIHADRLDGSLRLKGARFDDLQLPAYRETVDPASDEVKLLNPRGVEAAYFTDIGWMAADGSTVAVPTPDTLWTTDATEIVSGKPVTLSWNNGQGLTFSRTITVDKDYLITVAQSVKNDSGAPVSLVPYALVERHGEPAGHRNWLLHEGPMGVVGGVIEEYKYADLVKDKGGDIPATGGWFGITDKYWLVALLPDQARKMTYTVAHKSFPGKTPATPDEHFYVSYKGEPMQVAAGATLETTDKLYTGAKQFRLLKAYADSLQIPQLEYAVDFGWFWFLTVPFLWVLLSINDVIGNFGFSILLFTVFVKACVFPLANKSYRSMSRMKKLQPQLEKLREEAGGDQKKASVALGELYRREKVNPLSGCLPILVQIPVFFSLYKVLFISIEMRHAPFIGWIQDLSEKDPTNLFNLFGLIPWTPPEFLHIGAWPIFMGVSMWCLQMMQTKPSDPMQDRMMQFMPVLMTYMLAAFPAGLVIYWTWSNTLSVLQMAVIMSSMGVPVGRLGHARAAKKAAATAPAEKDKATGAAKT